MASRREEALVGVFVVVAAGLLVITLFALTGTRSGRVEYRSYFAFAGGLEPGAEVRYAGGPRVGRVEKVQIDPKNSQRLEITFSVDAQVPVKTDSLVKILSLNPLGDNHVEISAGSAGAARAVAGTTLPSEPFVGFNDLTAQISALGPDARQLLQNLNQRTAELKETIARVNDLLNGRNRENIADALGNIHGMLEENRPKVRSTLSNVDAASAKMGPLLDDLKKAVANADRSIAHVDEILGENRPDLRKAIADLRQTLASTNSLAAQMDRTLNVNAENIDEMLENIRHTTENLKQFTDTIKARPYTLIRSSQAPEHKPGDSKKP